MVDVGLNSNEAPNVNESRMDVLSEDGNEWDFEDAVEPDEVERAGVKRLF